MSTFRITVSWFYAINTLGGAFSALFTGFYFIKWMGVNQSIQLAALLNLAIGLTAIFMARKMEKGESETKASDIPSPDEKVERKPGLARQLLFVSFLSGFTAISYEVLWIRCLNYLINNSTYTFSLILFVFLTSIALGSLMNNFLKKVPNKERLLGVLQALLAVSALYSIYIFYDFAYSPSFADTFLGGGATSGWYDRVGLNLYLTLAIFLLPALIMGLSFPLISDLYYRARPMGSGEAISGIFVFNTLGSMLGALIPVFVLIPVLGSVKVSILFTGVISLVMAFYFFRRSKHFWVPSILTLTVFAVGIFATVKGEQLYSLEGLNEEGRTEKSLFYKEGKMATVKVYERANGNRAMSIDGVTIASDAFQAKEKFIAHLPFFTDRTVNKVLVVGLASGNTVRSLLLHEEFKKLDAVELVPTVLEASELFDRGAEPLPDQERVSIYLDDIISHLKYSESEYDVISSDGKFGPLNKANTTMLSEDYYQLCKTHLSPKGLMAQWISMELPNEHFKRILATVESVFPHTALFVLRKNMFMLSSKAPIQLDWAKIQSIFADDMLVRELKSANLYTPEEVVSTFSGELKLSSSPGINSFDHPLLEYDYNQKRQDDITTFRTSYLANLRFIQSLLANQADHPRFQEVMGKNTPRNYKQNKAFFDARVYYVDAFVKQGEGRVEEAIKDFEKVVELDHPDNVNDVALAAQAIGIYHLQKGELSEAEKYFTRSIQRLPTYHLNYTMRGISKFNSGKKEAARLDFEEALKLNPADQQASQWLEQLDQEPEKKEAP